MKIQEGRALPAIAPGSGMSPSTRSETSLQSGSTCFTMGGPSFCSCSGMSSGTVSPTGAIPKTNGPFTRSQHRFPSSRTCGRDMRARAAESPFLQCHIATGWAAATSTGLAGSTYLRWRDGGSSRIRSRETQSGSSTSGLSSRSDPRLRPCSPARTSTITTGPMPCGPRRCTCTMSTATDCRTWSRASTPTVTAWAGSSS